MIRIDNLSVTFGKKQVLHCSQMRFETAKVHGIIGLNGAGKTTFFNTLSGFLKPDTGQVTSNGKPVLRIDIGYLETNNFFTPTLPARNTSKFFRPPTLTSTSAN